MRVAVRLRNRQKLALAKSAVGEARDGLVVMLAQAVREQPSPARTATDRADGMAGAAPEAVHHAQLGRPSQRPIIDVPGVIERQQELITVAMASGGIIRAARQFETNAHPRHGGFRSLSGARAAPRPGRSRSWAEWGRTA